MIRAVANKRLDLSSSEYSYYRDIKESIGDDDFRGLFDTDKNGLITSISPPIDRKIPMVILFFLLNVMMNQRIRILDERFIKINNENLEDNINSILKRLSSIESAIKIDNTISED